MDAAAVAGAAAGAGGGGGVGGGAPVNNDEGIAGRVCEVSMDVAALQGVRGSVKVKHALRRVTDVGSHGGNNNHAGGGGAQPLGGAVSEGPLEVAAQAWQVMSITLADREAPAGPFNNIQVFFYDAWAERLDPLLQRGMLLSISGPPQIVRQHPGPDHFFALAIAEPTLLGGDAPADAAGARPLALTVRPAHAHPTHGPELVLRQGMDAGTVAQRVAAFRAALASAPAAHGGAGGAKGRRPSEYAYINLGDLVLSRFKGCEVNVYAVVAGFTQPRRTGGTDHMCSLLLVHPSRAAQPRRVPAPGQEEGDWPLEAVHPMQLVDRAKVVCNVFRPSVEKLPQPLRVGEVVRLHRVRVNEFQGNVQLLCHKKAHFLLVRRRRDHPQAGEGGAAAAVWEEAAWERVTSSETHTFTDADRQAVPALWDWAHREFLPAASLVDNFIRGPRTVEQVRKRLQNLPWQPRTAQGGGEGDGGEGEEDGPQPPMPPMPPAPSQQDDRQVGDFVGLVVARPGADALVVWDGTDVPAPGFVAGATAPSAAVVRALHAALGAARGREGRPEWGAALGEDAGEVGVPSVEHLGAMMKEAGRLDVYLPGVHRWRFQRLVDAGKAAPGTWVRMRHLEVQEVSVQEQLGLNPRVGVGLAAPGGGAGGRTTLRAAAGMLSSLNPLPPYCLDAQRVACRFLARQRQRSVPPCMMPFYRHGAPHRLGLPRAYIVEALGSSAPAVFALRARITDFHPKDVSRACIPLPPPSGAASSPMRRLRSAFGGQGQGQGQEQQQWTFFFSIRLEDETGALDTVVCGGGGDFFFNQKPVRACDLSRPEHEATRREVQTVLDKRVEQREHYDLLVQSCLVRVRGPEGEEGRQVKRFRILAVPDVRGGQQRGDVGPE